MIFLAPDRLWLLLAVPLVALAALALWRQRLAATAAWASHNLWSSLLPGYRRSRLLTSLALLVLALAAVVVGLGRPAWGTVEEEVERRGLDIVLVIDTSLSMTALDVAPSRLEVAKALAHDLVGSLGGHRLGMVHFEGAARVLSPLTTDRTMVRLLLDSLEAGSVPTPGSMLSTGLEAGLGLLPRGQSEGRPVLVLVSDGEDHSAGEWKTSLRALADSGVVVHTVGVGTSSGAHLPALDSSGTPFVLDRRGQQVVSRLEPDSLRLLAEATGGVYREVPSPHTDLAPVRDAILSMEGRLLETDTVVRSQERFQWFLATAWAFLVLHLMVGPFRGRRRAAP